MVCACAHGLGVPERIEGVADVRAVLVAFRGRAMSPRVKSRRQYGSSFCMLSWRAERSLSSAYNVVTFERKAIVRGVEWSSCEILCKCRFVVRMGVGRLAVVAVRLVLVFHISDLIGVRRPPGFKHITKARKRN